MQKNNIRTKGPLLLVYMAMFSALNLLFTRVLAFDLGPYRIAFGPVSSIMAGLWLGPVCGGFSGLAADILGCFTMGYAPNPLISVTALLWGLIPGFAGRRLQGLKKNRRMAVIAASIALPALLGSIGFTTAGLVLIQGYHFYAIFPGRLIQTVIMTPLYIVICSTLYFSPLTAIVRGSVYTEPVGV